MKVLFLSGIARSGTSWLGKIFAAHPGVLYHYEPFDMVGMRKKLDPKLRFWDMLPKLEKLVDKGRPEQAVRDFAKPLDRFWMVRDHTLDRPPYFPQPKGQIDTMVIKEDFTGVIEVCAAFGPVIQIVRDPRALLSSLWNHTVFGANYGALSVGKRWAEKNSKALDLAEAHPENYAVIKYEDLVNNSVAEAKKLFAWAGIPWDDKVSSFLIKSHQSHDKDHYGVNKVPEIALNAWRKALSVSVQEAVLRTVRGSRAAIELYNDFQT
jgi:hypothetical protein